MIKALTALLVSVVLSAGVATFAQELGSPGDENAIVKQLAAYASARNRNDAKAAALCFTDDADYRFNTESKVTGRAGIEKLITVADPAFRFSLEPANLRFLSNDVAIVEADVVAGAQAPPTKMIATYVMVRRNVVEWLIGAARIVPVTP
jgi:uncharacterized protein (TIGR02246 family)